MPRARPSTAYRLGCAALGLALAPVSAWAAIAGLPEPPTPRELPRLWFALNDDMLGDAILDTDDYRTGNADFGLCLGDLVVAGDYSAMTHRRDPSYSNGTRSDELTLTIGMRLDGWLPAELRRRSLLIAGVGARSDGDLGGEPAQNAIHRTFGFPQAELTYDHRGTSTTPLAYACGSIDSERWQPTRGNAMLVGQLEGAALLSARGEFQEHVGVNLSLLGEEGSAWIGCAYAWNRGRQASATAALVADHESGTWLSAGLAKRDGLFLSVGVDVRSHGITGSVGYAAEAPRPPAAAAAAGTGEIMLTEQDLEYFKGSGAIGLQVRGAWWRADGRDVLGGAWSCEWLFDYHFGSDLDYRWTGNRVDFDQLVIGIAPEYTLGTQWLPRWLPLQLQAFAELGAGVRVERVKVIDAAQHRFGQDTNGALVVQPGAGMRMRWCDAEGERHPRWYNLVWVGYGYDFWHPLTQAPISAGSDHADYLRPGMGGHYNIGFAISW
jgi:hypothetical protein